MRPSVSLSIVLAVATLAGACASPAQPSPRASGAPGSLSPTPARSSPPPRPTPEVRPAIAPGEPWLVLQAYDAARRTAIQLVRPDGTDAHPLLDGPGPGAEQSHPAWSPDGEWIAFDVWYPQPEGADRIEIWVARVDGTEAHVVASCEAPCLQLAYPAWSPDGRSIAHTRYDVRPDGTWGRAAIEVLDVASGRRHIVALTADGRTAYYEPRWSPDGRSIVITVETYPNEAQESIDSSFIAVIPADGEGPVEPVRITPDGAFAREPDWAPADRIVFALGTSDAAWSSTASIATIEPDGSNLRRVTDPTAGDAVAWEPVWADDGRTIMASTYAGTQRVATIDAASGRTDVSEWRPPVPGDPRRAHVHPRPAVAATGATDDHLVADGEAWIAYQGGTGGPARIRLVRPDGTGDHALAPDILAREQLHPDWSPDGTRIAFAADDGDGTRDLWVANVDGSDARKVFDCADPCGWSDDPAWSPDGRMIAFVSADHAGFGDSVAFLDLLDIATGEHRRVLQAPELAWCYVPRWSPGGARLVVECDVFRTARFDEEETTARTIGIVDTTAATPAFEPVLPWASWAAYPDWHPTEDRIVFELPATPGAAASDLWSVDLEGTNRTRLTTFADDGGRALQPTWSPDGAGLVFVGERTIGTPVAAATAADGSDVRFVGGGEVRTHPRLRPLP